MLIIKILIFRGDVNLSRKSRIIFEGAIYHIYQRGNNKEYILEDDGIKRFMLKYLEEYNKKFDYEVLAYAIMNNHYHLLIRTNKSSISEIMFFFNNLLGKHINGRLNRTGHAFEDRYKCELVETDAYLIWLLRYIHRNPVKAGICKDVKDYKWSSHCFYMENTSSYINVDFILNFLGKDKRSSIREYLKLVNSKGDESDKEKDYVLIKELMNYKKESLVVKRSSFSCKATIVNKRKTLDEIVNELSISEHTFMNIRNGRRHKELTPIKVAIVKRALEECYSLREIAEYLNIVPSAVSKLISRNEVIGHMTDIG